MRLETKKYLYDIQKRRHGFTVKLESGKVNPFAIGAQVTVIRRGNDALIRRVHTDSSYLSANDVRVHFGLGTYSLAIYRRAYRRRMSNLT